MSTLLHLPGLIDCHVHFREPGFEHKATLASEAASARAGGVLTVCEMPNTNPPTVSTDALADKVARADAVADCDIRFYFGVTEAEHLEQLKLLWTDPQHAALKARCCGLKLYLDHSTGNQKVEGGIVEEIFQTCSGLSIPLIAHCEDPDMNTEAQRVILSSSKDGTELDVSAHSTMRPPESEAKSIEYAISLVRKYGTAFHVAHMSTSLGADLVREAKSEGLPVTCEVAPHHLFLTTEDYAELGTLGKMNPPLRPPEHRDALWAAVLDGTVDCVATDHAPHTLEEKQAEPALEAPSGVPGVETMLPLLLTVAAGEWPHPNQQLAVSNWQFSYDDITRLCFTNPNQIFNLEAIDELRVTVDPEAEWTIHASDLHAKCGWTPYEGWQVKGKIISN